MFVLLLLACGEDYEKLVYLEDPAHFSDGVSITFDELEQVPDSGINTPVFEQKLQYTGGPFTTASVGALLYGLGETPLSVTLYTPYWLGWTQIAPEDCRENFDQFDWCVPLAMDGGQDVDPTGEFFLIVRSIMEPKSAIFVHYRDDNTSDSSL